MVKIALVLLLALIPSAFATSRAPGVVLAIHGGTADHEKVPPGREKQVRDGLEAALKAGYAVLSRGGAGLDAVEAAVKVLEDDPSFNAGKGAVFTGDGRNELEASLMDGKTRKAGAVTGVTAVKNPISAARAVLERTEHVFLMGDAVEALAKTAGLALVDPSYFATDYRREELKRVQTRMQGEEGKLSEETKGTVGAVALDTAGNLAVATSTGGRVNKLHGRVGDTPIIGASTYAENGLCAVSTTGHGEFFIRYVVAYDICAQAKYRKISLGAAAQSVIEEKLKAVKGNGGAIVLDPNGEVTFARNTVGMPRGYATKDGKFHTAVFD